MNDSSSALRSKPTNLFRNRAETERDPFTDTVLASSDAESTVSAAAESDALPDTFGRYRVVRSIGSGSFGDVYLGHDEVLHRPVAIKVPSASRLGGQQQLEHFLNEARAAARIQHPSVIAVYDFGCDDDGREFVVEEFIEGISLKDWAVRDRPEAAEIARVLADVADALQVIHDQGLVHRDIKPANILIDGAGRPHIADFGAALHVTQSLESAQLSGSPAYMSPEQTRGDRQPLDGRSDVWSVGVVLYELLTGKLPFSGGTLEQVFRAIRNDSPPRPSQVRDCIPVVLERICMNALSKDLNNRYRSALALAVELRQFSEDPSCTETVFDSERTVLLHGARGGPRGQRREQWKLVATAVFVIAFAITGFITSMFSRPEYRSGPTVERIVLQRGMSEGGSESTSNEAQPGRRVSSAAPVDGMQSRSSANRLTSRPRLQLPPEEKTASPDHSASSRD